MHNPDMTRFLILQQGVDFVLQSLGNMVGGIVRPETHVLLINWQGLVRIAQERSLDYDQGKKCTKF